MGWLAGERNIKGWQTPESTQLNAGALGNLVSVRQVANWVGYGVNLQMIGE